MKIWEFQDPRTGCGTMDQYPYADHVLVGNGTQAYLEEILRNA